MGFLVSRKRFDQLDRYATKLGRDVRDARARTLDAELRLGALERGETPKQVTLEYLPHPPVVVDDQWRQHVAEVFGSSFSMPERRWRWSCGKESGYAETEEEAIRAARRAVHPPVKSKSPSKRVKV